MVGKPYQGKIELIDINKSIKKKSQSPGLHAQTKLQHLISYFRAESWSLLLECTNININYKHIIFYLLLLIHLIQPIFIEDQPMGLHKRKKSKNPALTALPFWKIKGSEFYEDGTIFLQIIFLTHHVSKHSEAQQPSW